MTDDLYLLLNSNCTQTQLKKEMKRIRSRTFLTQKECEGVSFLNLTYFLKSDRKETEHDADDDETNNYMVLSVAEVVIQEKTPPKKSPSHCALLRIEMSEL